MGDKKAPVSLRDQAHKILEAITEDRVDRAIVYLLALLETQGK